MSYIIECRVFIDGSKAWLVPNPDPSRQPIHIKENTTYTLTNVMIFLNKKFYYKKQNREIN